MLELLEVAKINAAVKTTSKAKGSTAPKMK